MPFPVSRAFTIQTSLSVEETAARLRKASEQTDKYRTFNGAVTGSNFILARIDHNHPYAAQSGSIHGRIEQDGQGSLIVGERRQSAFSLGLVAVTLLALAFVCFKIIFASATRLLIPTAIIAVALALPFGSWALGIRKDLEALARVVEGTLRRDQ